MKNMIGIALKELRDSNSKLLDSYECILTVGDRESLIYNPSEKHMFPYASSCSIRVRHEGQVYSSQSLPLTDVSDESERSIALHSYSGASLALVLELTDRVRAKNEQEGKKLNLETQKPRVNSPAKAEEYKSQVDGGSESNLRLLGEIEQLKSVLKDKDKMIEELKECLVLAKAGEEIARKDFTPKLSSSAQNYRQAINEFESKTNEQQENIEFLKKEKEVLGNELGKVKSSLGLAENELEKVKLEMAELESVNMTLQSDCSNMQLKTKHEMKAIENDLSFSNFKIKALEEEKEMLQDSLSKIRKEFHDYKSQNKAKLKQLESGFLKKNEEWQALVDDLNNANTELTKVKAELNLAESKHEEITDQLKNYYEEYVENVNKEIERKNAQLESEAKERREELEKIQREKTNLMLKVSALEKKLKEKDDLIQALEASVAEKDDSIRKMNDFIKDQKASLTDHKNKGDFIQAELDVAKKTIQNYDKRYKKQVKINKENEKAIKNLTNELKECHEKLETLQATLSQQYIKEKYIPLKADPIDVAMAQYINERDIPLEVPFIREDSGIYKFGFKRVFVKIENGVLVIRVGGGYMLIEEFIELYSPIEMEKILYKSRRNNQTVMNIISQSEFFDKQPKKSGSSEFLGELQSKSLFGNVEEGRFTAMYTPKRVQSKANAIKRSSTMNNKEYENLLKKYQV